MALAKINCYYCSIEFYREIKHINATQGNKSFCTSKCYDQWRVKPTNTFCASCNAPIKIQPSRLKKSRSGRNFCSHSCSNYYRNQQYDGNKHPNWIGGSGFYRRTAMKHYGERCQSPDCEIIKAGILTPKLLLDVHHIDSNRANNDISNLIVLCVWCHAKITRKNWENKEPKVFKQRMEKHGTNTEYNRGCRCNLCREHNNGRLRRLRSAQKELISP